MDSFGTACNVTGDGAVAVILSLIFMPFMATAVKSSDNFLKRAFDLR